MRGIRLEHGDPDSWTLWHDNTFNGSLPRDLNRRLIPSGQHSPDLTPKDYFLFPKLDLKTKGCVFDDITTIQRACTKDAVYRGGSIEAMLPLDILLFDSTHCRLVWH